MPPRRDSTQILIITLKTKSKERLDTLRRNGHIHTPQENLKIQDTEILSVSVQKPQYHRQFLIITLKTKTRARWGEAQDKQWLLLHSTWQP